MAKYNTDWHLELLDKMDYDIAPTDLVIADMIMQEIGLRPIVSAHTDGSVFVEYGWHTEAVIRGGRIGIKLINTDKLLANDVTLADAVKIIKKNIGRL